MEDILEKLKIIEVREGRERQIKSYVLRNNKLEEKDEKMVLENAEKYMLFFDKEKKMNFSEIFGNDDPTVMEIGFGMGDTSLKIAMRRPDTNFICLEVFLQGIVKLLRNTAEAEIDNLKIMRFNAVDVLNWMVPDESLDGFHIFFPDPWMKKKHHKRRIIQPDFVNLLARKLKKGGYIYCVTDWEEYAAEMLEILGNEPLIENRFDGYADPVVWRPTTKFEQKGMDKNYVINELWFEKK